MTPREIDALVASKVMGLVPCSNPIGKCELAAKGLCWGTGGAGTDLMPYSTDIAAAWEVVEKMQADGWFTSATDQTHHSMGWAWRFHHHSNGKLDAHAFARGKAPMAICLAALKAVGVDIPKKCGEPLATAALQVQ